MKVPDPIEYPQQAETIRKKKAALSAKFASDLFGGTSTIVVDEEPQVEYMEKETDPEEVLTIRRRRQINQSMSNL